MTGPPGSVATARALPTWAVSVGLAVALVAVAVLKYGVGSFPQWVTLYDIGVHWTDPRVGAGLDAGNDYLLGNSLAAVLAGMTGLLRSREAYGLVMLALTVGALVLPFLMPAVRRSPERSRLLFLVLLGGPVVAILMIWVGGYDPLTVIAASLIGLGRSRWTVGAGWVIFGLNHYSMAAVGLALFVVVVLAARPEQPWRCRITDVAVCALGALTGAVVSLTLTTVWGGSSPRTTSDFVPVLAPGFWEDYLHLLPAVVLSALGLGWVVFGALAWRRRRSALVALGVVLASALLVPFIGYDATRDVALAVLPSILALGVLCAADARPLLRGWRWWAAVAVVVAAPTMLVFGWQVSWVGWGL